jgi:predicted nucleic acid-binding protein
MTFVDTSVWVDHFRRGNPALEALLLDGEVPCHTFVIGELACGNLKRRTETMALLRALPDVPLADTDDLLTFIDHHRLMATGRGWVDVHILSSALLAHTRLLTLDRPLARVADRLGLLAQRA